MTLVAERDESAVHARDTYDTVRCGRMRAEVRYVVAAEEFLHLKSPPAPWCEECAAALALGQIALRDSIGPPA